MKLDLSCSVWVLAVSLLPLVRITAGSILGAAVNIELLDQDRSQPVRHHTMAFSVPYIKKHLDLKPLIQALFIYSLYC